MSEKKAKISVTYELYIDVPEDWDEHTAAFYVEENHCLDNHVDQLAREIAARPGYCGTCYRGEAKFVGFCDPPRSE